MQNDYSYLIGKPVRVYDAAPKPPARFTRKLEAWENSNYEGTIVEAGPYPSGDIVITINYKNMVTASGVTYATFNKTALVRGTGNGKFWDGKRNYDVAL